MARKAATKAPKSKTSAPAADVASVVAPPEVIAVASHRVACDGVGGALGHPRVYLEMGEAGFVECPYCDRRFELATSGKAQSHAPGVYEGAGGH